MRRSNVESLIYNDFVTEYDAQAFAGLLITDNKMNTEQKRYLNAMAVSLLGRDTENIAKFVKNFRFDHDNPEHFAVEIHPYADLPRRVWDAQAQTLFPLIMRECREFIDKWIDRLEDAFIYANKVLPDGLLDTRNQPVETPDEMELAQIYYLMNRKRRESDGNDSENYMLYIPDENARSRLKLLYNMRNVIAHGKVCAVEDVARLLSLAH